MVIYEVNLDVEQTVAADYARWLERHIREMLAIDGFVGATWLEREPDAGEDDTAGGTVRWTVWYRLRDRDALASYLERHAPRMRADGQRLFGGRFRASRRVLREIDDRPRAGAS